MSYDQKTRTVVIGETDPNGDLAKGIAQYMAHTEREVALELEAKKRRERRERWLKRRPVLIGAAVWAVFVLWRTYWSGEFLGFDFNNWNENSLWLNLFAPPAILALAVLTYRKFRPKA